MLHRAIPTRGSDLVDEGAAPALGLSLEWLLAVGACAAFWTAVGLAVAL